MEMKKQKSNNKKSIKKNSIKKNIIKENTTKKSMPKEIITEENTTIKDVTDEKTINKNNSDQKSIKIFLPIVLLIVLVACVFAYVSYVKKEERIVEIINVDETVQETIPSYDTIPSYQTVPSYQTIPSGTYFDILSERATMDVSFKDKIYYFEVNWANSASENMRWTFSGNYDKFSGIVSYDNAKCIYSIYDEDGNADERVIFDNGKGVMKFDNNKLYWDDNNSDKALDAHYNGIFELPNGV